MITGVDRTLEDSGDVIVEVRFCNTCGRPMGDRGDDRTAASFFGGSSIWCGACVAAWMKRARHGFFSADWTIVAATYYEPFRWPTAGDTNEAIRRGIEIITKRYGGGVP